MARFTLTLDANPDLKVAQAFISELMKLCRRHDVRMHVAPHNPRQPLHQFALSRVAMVPSGMTVDTQGRVTVHGETEIGVTRIVNAEHVVAAIVIDWKETT